MFYTYTAQTAMVRGGGRQAYAPVGRCGKVWKGGPSAVHNKADVRSTPERLSQGWRRFTLPPHIAFPHNAFHTCRLEHHPDQMRTAYTPSPHFLSHFHSRPQAVTSCALLTLHLHTFSHTSIHARRLEHHRDQLRYMSFGRHG